MNFNFFYKGNEEKVKLNVSLTLESILDLDEVKSMLKLQIQLKVSWMDSRLEFVNLDPKVNSINLIQKKELWLPSLIFENTNDKKEASFVDDSSLGWIELDPTAKSYTAPLIDIHNYKKYAGSEG